MRNDSHASWMISPKSFVSLLGAEYHLMRDAGVLRRFYISSVLIVIILLTTWISIKYACDLLFHTIAVEITLAIFFSLLFFCTYIFLLNTFAKESRAQKGALNFSNVIRTGFVLFMAFLIAQPLNMMFYAHRLYPIVEGHKPEVLKAHLKKIDELMADEINTLVNSKRYYLQQKQLFGTLVYDNELTKVTSKLLVLDGNVAALHQSAQQTIQQSSFFLYRVEKLNNNFPASWLLTLLTVLLFLSPGYLIYTISSQHEYYALKKAREKEIITAAYNEFTRRYTKMFGDQITIFSRYQDPPFNTIRKQLPHSASAADFLKKYLSDS